MTEDKTTYLARIAGKRAELAISGRASHSNCAGLSPFFERALSEGCEEIVVDCRECSGMDSTVLGILAGAALKVRKIRGKMKLTNLNSRNMELVENLGLDKILEADSEGEKLPVEGKPVPEGAASASEILDAHEVLVEAHEENAEKFVDVINFLRKDLEGKESKK